MVASCTLALAAGSQTLSDLVVTQLRLKPDVAREALSPAALPGFTRHGTSLVGEVRMRDGTTMRLVFDARSYMLIGLKTIETPKTPMAPPHTATAASSPRDCADDAPNAPDTPNAPLPRARAPAN